MLRSQARQMSFCYSLTTWVSNRYSFPSKRSNSMRMCGILIVNDKNLAPNTGTNQNITTPLAEHMTFGREKHQTERTTKHVLSANRCVRHATSSLRWYGSTREWHWRCGRSSTMRPYWAEFSRTLMTHERTVHLEPENNQQHKHTNTYATCERDNSV